MESPRVELHGVGKVVNVTVEAGEAGEAGEAAML